jgi:hypothetical protein
MNRRLPLLGGAVLLVILAAGFAGYAWKRAAVIRGADLALASHRAELEMQFRAAQRDLQQARHLRSVPGLLPEAAAIPPAAGIGRAGAAPQGNSSAWFAAHPEARRHYIQAFREGLSTTWGLFFKALNLPPDQEEKLKDLLAQREDNNLAVEAAASVRGLDESAPEIQALDDQLDGANKAALKELLGKADYAAFRTFLHAEEILPLVDQLAANVYDTPTPLTGDQAMALTQVLADSSQKKDSGRVVAGTINWNQALGRVQSILSPTQVGAFLALQQQADAQGQLKQMMLGLSSAAPGKAGN